MTTEVYKVGDRVKMAVVYGVNVVEGELGTVIACPHCGADPGCEKHGGFVDVRWDAGHVRGYGDGYLLRVP